MKKEDIIILVATFLGGVMVLAFTIMLVFIGNHTDELVSETAKSTETNFVLEESQDRVYEETGAGQEEIALPEYQTYEEIEKQILTEDEVDLFVEDTAIHEVEYESTYINTMELVPSTRDKREEVPADKVSRENFTTSSLGDEKCVVTISTVNREGLEEQVNISVPNEVFLYNVDNQRSNSCEIRVDIEGEASMVRSIGWSSDDSSVLDFSRTSGEKTTVRRQSDFTGNRSVTVLISYFNAEGISDTEELNITVHVMNMTDQSSRLYDKNGVALYKDMEGKHPAYLADFREQEMFYGAVKTTGWQNIDGETYYFTASGWPVTGIQIIGGTRYTFDENGVLVSDVGERGIDVSRYQKVIDWEQVAADGIDFAIIRCGFRGSRSGQLVEDSYFRRNIEEATKAGVKVGIYFFTQAVTEQEAEEEALMALALTRDYHLDLPIFIDSENAVNGRANDLDRDTRTRILKTFCETVTRGGSTAGVYASKYWYYQKVNADELEQYVIWVAQYSPVCDYKGKMDYWQYSSKESVKGIVGNVDMDIVYTNR